MKDINYIPNLITTLRMICSFVLLLIKPLSSLFFIFYILCGASDVLDGYIARKTKTNSSFGAVFDSISDFIFIAVVLIIIAPLFPWSVWMLYWIGGIAITRFLSLAIGFAKYHTITSLHTYANKATGFVLFFFPLLYSIFDSDRSVIFVCSVASMSAMEELTITIKSKKLNRDIRSVIDK